MASQTSLLANLVMISTQIPLFPEKWNYLFVAVRLSDEHIFGMKTNATG